MRNNCLTFPEEYIFSESLDITKGIKNSNYDVDVKYSHTSMHGILMHTTAKKKIQCMHLLDSLTQELHL